MMFGEEFPPARRTLESLPSQERKVCDELALNAGKVLIYDYELNSAYKVIKNLYETFTNAKKRFERHETVGVAKSAFHYLQLTKDIVSYPYVLYDFVSRSVRICLVKKEGQYHIYCTGFSPDFNYKYSKLGVPDLYFDADELNDLIPYWRDMIKDFINRENEVLF